MPLIEWHPSFSVSVQEIDKQHQILVDMINDLFDAMASGKERAVLKKIISQLMVYAAMHFAKEEHYFDSLGYPETGQHKKEHDDFERKVTEFETGFNNGTQELSKEIISFLGDWLVEHIKGSDMRYGSFLNARGIF